MNATTDIKLITPLATVTVGAASESTTLKALYTYDNVLIDIDVKRALF